jgi:hypothetical protein
VNERAQRMDERLEPWFLIAALLVIPDVAIDARYGVEIAWEPAPFSR